MKARRRKIYVLVIALGLGALLVDRWVRGGPASAAAEAVPDAAASSADAQPGSDAGRQALVNAVVPFPDAGGETIEPGLRDPFALNPSVAAVLVPADAAALDGRPGPQSAGTGREEFAERHHLAMLMRTDGHWAAVIDDRVMLPGQVLDECELREITAQAAVFECADGPVRLVLPDPLGAGAAK